MITLVAKFSKKIMLNLIVKHLKKLQVLLKNNVPFYAKKRTMKGFQFGGSLHSFVPHCLFRILFLSHSFITLS